MSNISDPVSLNPVSLDFSSDHLAILENWRTASSDDISIIKDKTTGIIKFFNPSSSSNSSNFPSSIRMSPVFSRPYIVLHVEDNTGIKYSTVILLHSKVAKIFLHKFHEIYNIENNSYREDSYTKEGKKYVEENDIRNEFTTLRYPQVYEDFSIFATKYNDIFLIRSDNPFEKIPIREINGSSSIIKDFEPEITKFHRVPSKDFKLGKRDWKAFYIMWDSHGFNILTSFLDINTGEIDINSSLQGNDTISLLGVRFVGENIEHFVLDVIEEDQVIFEAINTPDRLKDIIHGFYLDEAGKWTSTDNRYFDKHANLIKSKYYDVQS